MVSLHLIVQKSKSPKVKKLHKDRHKKENGENKILIKNSGGKICLFQNNCLILQ